MNEFSRLRKTIFLLVLGCLFFTPVQIYTEGEWLSSSSSETERAGIADSSIMTYGSPQYNPLRIRDGYVVSYDGRTKNPYWVYERITLENLNGHGKRKYSNFREDDSIPRIHRASLKDFKWSGFDRGHMAPAADHKNSQKAMDETFLLTNVSPQVGVGFNQHYWARIEGLFRKMLTSNPKENISLHIITGTLFLPNYTDEQGHHFVTYQVIGENNVAVPTHFYKIVLLEKTLGRLDGYAILAPNEPIDSKVPFNEFSTSISEIERLSGLIFFDQLDREYPPRIDKSLANVIPG